MELITRPRRKRRVIAEPYDSYTFHLPVDLMERFRRVAESERKAYSESAEEAFRIFLAAKFQVPDTHSNQERSNGR
jgi:hypothetical protein